MLTLHGIRINISGCVSGCARHNTADVGLKGVRVRKLFGTREGFDVYLGGGVAGQVHLGLLYRSGVEVEQLPQLLEEVIRDFYLRHDPGQTFSMYWREKLRTSVEAGDGAEPAPIWICESCQYRHEGEDPPIFCPKCAALRRHFARSEVAGLEGEPSASSSSRELVQVNGQPTPLVQILPKIEDAPDGAVHRVAETLLDWLKGFVGETSVTVPSANGRSPKRGRPKDPKVAERNALICRLSREHPALSHSDLARLVERECGDETTTHMIRNALKAAKRHR
jgi:hypothetical protein